MQYQNHVTIRPMIWAMCLTYLHITVIEIQFEICVGYVFFLYLIVSSQPQTNMKM